LKLLEFDTVFPYNYTERLSINNTLYNSTLKDIFRISPEIKVLYNDIIDTEENEEMKKILSEYLDTMLGEKVFYIVS
jgi:hypothetical protein